MTAEETRLRGGREVTAAVLLLLNSIPGVVLCALLSHHRFQLDYTPCRAPTFGCEQLDGTVCVAAIESGAATLFSIPISLHGGAFYVAAAGICTLLLSGRATAFARYTLFLLYSAATLVSIALAAYAAIYTSVLCLQCLGLYTVNLAGFILALTCLYNPLAPESREIKDAARQAATRITDGFFRVALAFMLLLCAQVCLYRLAGAQIDGDAVCPPPALIHPPPDAHLRHGAEQPSVVFSVFLDPSAEGSARDWPIVRRLMLVELDAGAAFEFMLAPAACAQWVTPWGEVDAGRDNACAISLSVLCAEQLRPGSGLHLLNWALTVDRAQLQRERRLFAREVLARNVADEDVAGVIPEELLKCVEDTGSSLHARLQSSLEYVDELGSSSLPFVVRAQVTDGQRDMSSARVFNVHALDAAEPPVAPRGDEDHRSARRREI